jgi:hypothetical protein
MRGFYAGYPGLLQLVTRRVTNWRYPPPRRLAVRAAPGCGSVGDGQFPPLGLTYKCFSAIIARYPTSTSGCSGETAAFCAYAVATFRRKSCQVPIPDLRHGRCVTTWAIIDGSGRNASARLPSSSATSTHEIQERKSGGNASHTMIDAHVWVRRIARIDGKWPVPERAPALLPAVPAVL